jgi:protein-tyrosine phosphatase
MLTADEPAMADGVAVMAARGLDLTNHRSRRLTAPMIAGADLVIGMARRHVAEVCMLVPDVWPRAFTLKELVRRGEEVGPRRADQDVDAWLAAVHDGRSRRDLVGEDATDDIDDPVGRPRAVYEEKAAEIDGLLERLATLLWSETRQPAAREAR